MLFFSFYTLYYQNMIIRGQKRKNFSTTFLPNFFSYFVTREKFPTQYFVANIDARKSLEFHWNTIDCVNFHNIEGPSRKKNDSKFSLKHFEQIKTFWSWALNSGSSSLQSKYNSLDVIEIVPGMINPGVKSLHLAVKLAVSSIIFIIFCSKRIKVRGIFDLATL